MELIESRSTRVNQKNIRIASQCSESLFIQGDFNLILLALGNILDNAIDFSPQDGSIEIEAHSESEVLHITIRDQGPGIPKWALDKVSSMFFSLPRPGSEHRSTGLGLSLVKEIISLHRGIVVISNLISQGTEVRITIPQQHG